MKYILKFIVAIFLFTSFSSCKVKQSITDVIIFDDNEPIVNNDTIVDTVIIVTETIDTIITEPQLLLKDEYNIAIVLPLHTDSIKNRWVSIDDSEIKDFNIPEQAVKSLSFIEGMILALKEINETDLKLNIKVYDNKSSFLETTNIINKLGFETVDFIVGPMQNKNIQLVSSFAKKNDIIMISPFSHSKKASSNHTKYIMPDPSLEIHIKEISNFIKDSMPSCNIQIMHPNTIKGNKYANLLQNNLNDINRNNIIDTSRSISYTFVEIEEKTNDRKKFDVEQYLSKNILNVVIILPASSGFVHNMLTSLNQQLKDYDINVFGMPNWKNSNVLRLDYFNSLKVHYSDTKWIDKKDFATKTFISNYKSKYKTSPTDEAFLAYDIFKFFSKVISKYGLSLTEHIEKEKYSGIYTNFFFETRYEVVYNENNTEYIPIRIENNALHIISYNKFQLKLEK